MLHRNRERRPAAYHDYHHELLMRLPLHERVAHVVATDWIYHGVYEKAAEGIGNIPYNWRRFRREIGQMSRRHH